MNNDCPDCTQSRQIWHWGGYHATCLGCRTRALAKGLGFSQSRRNKSLSTEYRAALQTIFGEKWMDGHDAVKAEAARIEQLKKGTSL